ncbi:uncharacterized protein G2W53_036078 [Senna tora]|uniref:Uncharacterized protein n=1 Tax=Senna tora TaxID=362788 RepID=A0A834SS22_9FABA|nr:uncharacterized protein G2W53_036078 [Senna tora]
MAGLGGSMDSRRRTRSLIDVVDHVGGCDDVVGEYF